MIGNLGNIEIDNFELSLVIDQHIVRLHIAMNHPVLVD